MSSRAGDTGSSSLMVGTSPLKRRWQWHLRHYRRRVEPSPLVPHLEPYLFPPLCQSDAHRAGLGELFHVIECFLGDPEERDLYFGRQPLSLEGFLVADLPTLIP